MTIPVLGQKQLDAYFIKNKVPESFAAMYFLCSFVYFFENKISGFMIKQFLFSVFACGLYLFSNAQWTNIASGNETNQIAGCNAFAIGRDGVAYAGNGNSLMKYQQGLWTSITPTAYPNLNVLQLLAAPDSSVYVGCIDSNDGAKAIVLQYKNGIWNRVGPSVSNAVSNRMALTLSQDGSLYMVYADSTTTYPPFTVPCYVKKFTAASWVMLGGGRAGINTTSSAISIAIDSNGDPHTSIGINQVKKLQGGVWTDITPLSHFGDGTLIASPSRRLIYLCSLEKLYAFSDDNPSFPQEIDPPSPYSRLSKLVMQSDSNLVVMDSGKHVYRYNIAAESWIRLATINNWASVGGLTLGIADTPHIYWPGSFFYGVAKLNGATWETLGNGGISGGISDYSKIVVDAQQVPYVLFNDLKNGGATVMKFVNNSWQSVGTPGSLPVSGSIAISPTGGIYVSGNTGADQRLSVYTFNGNTWVLVGAANFSLPQASESELAFSANGNLYIGYTAYNIISDEYSPSVMQFQNGNWSYIGQPFAYNGGTNFFTFAVAPNGIPYIGFGDIGSSFDASVMRYTNGNWSFVGAQGFSNVDRNVTMVIATDGTPYFAGRNLTDNGKISVLQYKNNAWSYVGPPSFSLGRADWPSLTISTDNKLVVSYFDRTVNGVVSKKYGNNAWMQLGGVVSLNGVALQSSPAVSPNNADLYIAYHLSGTYVKRFTAFDSSLRLCSGGNTLLNASSTGAVYQWQVNTGTGFVNITDNANYVGTATNVLRLQNLPGNFYGYQYRCVVDGNAGPPHLIKYVNTWIGAVDNHWSNPLNWSCGSVPNAFMDVEINAGTVVVDANAICRTLLLNPSVSYTVLSGVTVTVLQ